MRRRLPEFLALAAAAAILAVILLVPPPVGVADDGDFNKITRLFNFDAPVPSDDDRWFKYIFLEYKFDPAWHWWSGYPSSEMLLGLPALGLNRLVSRPGVFDLRMMGIVHGALFLLALGLFLPLLRKATPLRRALVTCAAILVFCDVMYVSYYNSFYMDAAALLFLLLAAVFFLRITCADPAHAADHAGFAVSCLLLVTAKFQHSLTGILLAALLICRGRFKTAGLVAAASLFWMLQVPPDYAATARYNVIFYGLLPHSVDRSRDLAELGLDDSYRPKIGLYAYNDNSGMNDPAYQQAFGARATFARLALYYLRHPAVVARKLHAGLQEAASQRPRLGNYARGAAKGPFAQSRAFSAWSGLKQKVFEWRPFLYEFYCAAVCVLLPLLVGRRGIAGHRRWMEGAVALASMAVLILLIGCLGDSLDFLRHLFLFNACIDMLALACLAALPIRA